MGGRLFRVPTGCAAGPARTVSAGVGCAIRPSAVALQGRSRIGWISFGRQSVRSPSRGPAAAVSVCYRNEGFARAISVAAQSVSSVRRRGPR
ncbi:hypothetical protein C5E41_21630 [Nocardia nova]|nr:hypothetical protein C5E41_21630 [Nocardia nova]